MANTIYFITYIKKVCSHVLAIWLILHIAFPREISCPASRAALVSPPPHTNTTNHVSNRGKPIQLTTPQGANILVSKVSYRRRFRNRFRTTNVPRLKPTTSSGTRTRTDTIIAGFQYGGQQLDYVRYRTTDGSEGVRVKLRRRIIANVVPRLVVWLERDEGEGSRRGRLTSRALPSESRPTGERSQVVTVRPGPAAPGRGRGAGTTEGRRAPTGDQTTVLSTTASTPDHKDAADEKHKDHQEDDQQQEEEEEKSGGDSSDKAMRNALDDAIQLNGGKEIPSFFFRCLNNSTLSGRHSCTHAHYFMEVAEKLTANRLTFQADMTLAEKMHQKVHQTKISWPEGFSLDREKLSRRYDNNAYLKTTSEAEEDSAALKFMQSILDDLFSELDKAKRKPGEVFVTDLAREIQQVGNLFMRRHVLDLLFLLLIGKVQGDSDHAEEQPVELKDD